nr:MAG TPA: hypothetical protein [Caudoviricetes sp.]
MILRNITKIFYFTRFIIVLQICRLLNYFFMHKKR